MADDGGHHQSSACWTTDLQEVIKKRRKRNGKRSDNHHAVNEKKSEGAVSPQPVKPSDQHKRESVDLAQVWGSITTRSIDAKQRLWQTLNWKQKQSAIIIFIFFADFTIGSDNCSALLLWLTSCYAVPSFWEDSRDPNHLWSKLSSLLCTSMMWWLLSCSSWLGRLWSQTK